MKRGDRNTARSLAEQAVSLAPRSEEPLLFLAALTSPEVSLAYIKQALRINPESQPARRALEWARKRQRDGSAIPEDDLEEDPFEIGPLLYAKLASLADSVLEPNPPPKPTRPPVSPSISPGTLPEPEPPSALVSQPASPAILAEMPEEPASLSERIQPPASPAVSAPARGMPKPQVGSIQRAAGPAVPVVSSSPAARPSRPAVARKKSSLSTTIILGLSLLGVLVIAGLLALFFGGSLLGGISRGVQPLQPAPASPTLFVPTPDCGTPTLVLGSTTYQIQTIQRAPDGSLSVPPDTAGVAHWVEDTHNNYVFVLAPTSKNLSHFLTVNAESIAKATWSNCNSTTYKLSTPESGSLSDFSWPDQSTDGITIFFQTDSSGAGFVARGELTEEQISVIDTPVSGGTEIQAEISLLETFPSSDGSTIRIGVSIQNYGQSAMTLASNDIALTSQGAAPLAMLDSEPALPREIGTGETDTIFFTFPRPSTTNATLNVLGVEYDIEGY